MMLNLEQYENPNFAKSAEIFQISIIPELINNRVNMVVKPLKSSE